MKDQRVKKQNNKFSILLLYLLLILICSVIGLFAMAKFTKEDQNTVDLKFKKAVIEEENIIYKPTTNAKSVKVTIENEDSGKIQYKIGEDGTWTDYTQEFEVFNNDNLYAKLVFSDGEGPITVKKIDSIIQEPRVTINAQDMIVKNGLLMQLDGANNTGEGNYKDTDIWTDLSGNKKNGTIKGATWQENSLNFDGQNDWVNCDKSNTDYKTIEVTFAFNKLDTTENQYIIGNWQSGGGGILFNSKTKRIAGQYYIDGTYHNVISQMDIEPNNKYTVSLTYDGNKVKLYINGILNSEKEISGVIKQTSEVMAIGRQPSNSLRWFNGRVYSARIYDRGLTEDEVKTNYISDQILVNGITNGNNLKYTFFWDEEVDDFLVDDIKVTNATKGTFTEIEEKKVYTLDVSAEDNTQISLNVPKDVCKDKQDNNNIASEEKTLTIDRILPIRGPDLTLKAVDSTGEVKGIISGSSTNTSGTVYTNTSSSYLEFSNGVDSESGVQSYKYTASSEGNLLSTSIANKVTFTATESGTDYSVNTIDKAGNISDICTTMTVKLDVTPPTTTAPTVTATTNSITVTNKQADSGSGIKTVQYAIKKGDTWSEWQSSNIFDKLDGGIFCGITYIVKTKTTDNVGNSSESDETTIKTATYDYDITYNLNSGSVSSNPTKYTSGIETTINAPTRTGYTFAGWSRKYITTWSSGFINLNTGKVEVNSGSKYSSCMYLESGVIYTINTNYTGGIRWRAYDLNGNYIGNVSNANTYTPTSNCYVRILFYEAPTTEELNATTVTIGGTTKSGTISANYRRSLQYTAHWTANVYTITLNNQSATTAGSTAIYEKYATGIYKESSCTTAMTTSANAITVPSRAYTVTFNYNGNGTANTTATATWTFGGYYTATGGGGTQRIGANGYITTNLTNTTYTANATLYAKWTGGTVSLPSPTRTGYTFAGWYTAASGGTQVTSSTQIKSSQTLYAHWTANVYTITLNNQDATTAGSTAIYEKYATGIYKESSCTTAMTTSANAITVPSRAYTVTFNYNGNGTANTTATATWTFGGYYTATGGGGTQRIGANGYITTNLTNTTYTANATLYAKWTGGTVSLPSPTRTGYTFAGWYTAASGGTQVTSSTQIKSSQTLYAHWTANVYTITLNNQSATTAGSTAIYEKYATGIYKESSCTTAMTTSANAITVPSRAYTVTFNYNGNGTANTTATATWTFGGYYTATGGGGTQRIGANGYITTNLTNTTYTANATLYAKWTGGTVSLPSPTRTGYTFAGWYTAASGGTQVTSSTQIKSSQTLYAHWTANVYTITLNNQDATTAGSTAVYKKYATGIYKESSCTNEMTTTKNPITIPKRQYTITFDSNGGTTCSSVTSTYSFKGYYATNSSYSPQYIDANGYITTNFSTTTASASTLYAIWSGGKIDLPTPTREGYRFDGWCLNESDNNGTGTPVSNTTANVYTPTSTRTLYAKWTPYDAKIGDTYYLTLQDAVDAAGGLQETINLLRNVTYTSTVKAKEYSYFILDLGGYTITSSADNVIEIINPYRPTIKNGSIVHTKAVVEGYPACIKIEDQESSLNNGMVQIQDVNLTSNEGIGIYNQGIMVDYSDGTINTNMMCIYNGTHGDDGLSEIYLSSSSGYNSAKPRLISSDNWAIANYGGSVFIDSGYYEGGCLNYDTVLFGSTSASATNVYPIMQKGNITVENLGRFTFNAGIIRTTITTTWCSGDIEARNGYTITTSIYNTNGFQARLTASATTTSLSAEAFSLGSSLASINQTAEKIVTNSASANNEVTDLKEGIENDDVASGGEPPEENSITMKVKIGDKEYK